MSRYGARPYPYIARQNHPFVGTVRLALKPGGHLGNISVVKSPGTLIDATQATAEACAQPVPADARTRDRVAKAMLEHGPTSAAALAELLGLTPAAVRRHLDAMTAEGRVIGVAERPVRGKVRGRGRPARLFALSEAGRNAFPKGYDELAASALRFLAETGGDAAVEAFAQRRLAGVEERYQALIGTQDDGGPARLEALAAALTADGYAASTQVTPAGVQLCQHHCPVAHVAAEFPALCEAETAAFSRLLGTHVQRLATLAHGDGVCTTHIPNAHLPNSITSPNAHVPTSSTSPRRDLP
jgi:predicted ArsR family transcriptional regulator